LLEASKEFQIAIGGVGENAAVEHRSELWVDELGKCLDIARVAGIDKPSGKVFDALAVHDGSLIGMAMLRTVASTLERDRAVAYRKMVDHIT
jgi:hypothetical protein